jgi:hypothetical protein
MENHFGMLDFDLKNNTIRLQIVDRDKTLRINYSVKWDVLK